jgi:molecular chaperone DnaK
MTKILGIDLGTTRSVMAVIEGGEPVVIPNAEGYRTTPSVVAFLADGATLVGEPALRQLVVNPTNTVRSVKRFIGRLYDDPAVVHERQYVSYALVPAPNNEVWIEAHGKTYTPTEVSAIILRKLKVDAEAYLGEPVKDAIITVPAYFTQTQRDATREAGALAGLNVMRMLNEPTAAAIAYGLGRSKDERILVYDFGGGTFDVTVLELGQGVIEVKSTQGDAHLGGDDFDERVVEWLAAEFTRTHGVDPRDDPQAYHRLREAAEQARIDLSQARQTSVTLPYLWNQSAGPAHLVSQLTRERLERLTADLIDRSIDCVALALADAAETPKQFDHIVLAGGMTRMPAIRERLAELFQQRIHDGLNQDEVVAIGAAIQGGVLSGEVRDTLLLDAISHSLGIEIAGGGVARLVDRHTTIPTLKSLGCTTSVDGQQEVDLHLVEGDDERAQENTTLALFTFDQIPPAPQGVVQLEVTLDIDANNGLIVRCRDKGLERELRKYVTSAERRLARPRPEALPSVLQPAPYIPPPPPAADAPPPTAEDISKYHQAQAMELTSTWRLEFADGASFKLPRYRQGSSWGMMLVTTARADASRINFSVTSAAGVFARLVADGLADPRGGAARVLLYYELLVPYIETPEEARLLLRATELYTQREWSSTFYLLEARDLEPRLIDLPLQVRVVSSERPVAPPPLRPRTSPRQPPSLAQAPGAARTIPPIFVSHTHADSGYCREFVSELRQAGADVWFDEDDMSDGMLLDIVQQELSARPVFMVILSPAALNRSRWVKLEVTMAFQKLLSDERWHLLPVTGAPITASDLGDHWLALQSLYRIEGPALQPLAPRDAAREALQRLR